MWETWMRSLGWKDPLEKGKATHSSILAWRTLWTVSSTGSQRIRHDRATFSFTLCLLGSVQFSRSVTSNSLRPHGLQHARPPCPSLTPRVHSNSCPLSRWCWLIQPSHPLLSPSPPAFNLSQHQGLFKRVSSSHQVAKVLEFQLQHQSFQWIFRIDFL